MAVGVYGLYCHIVFYINDRTRRLAALWSYSPEVVGPGQSHSGEAAAQAERRVRRAAQAGCLSGFFLGNRQTRAELYMFVIGGHYYQTGTGELIRGGHIGAFALESNRHPVGLLFC